MKINVKYISRDFFDDRLRNWIFSFKKYKHMKGFNIRVFGLHFNVIEKGGVEKLKQKYNVPNMLIMENQRSKASCKSNVT